VLVRMTDVNTTKTIVRPAK